MIDLRPQFPGLYWRPMPHSFGVPVASAWADKADDDPVFGIFKRCGLWTMDEVQILYKTAKRIGGDWVDVGSNVGWTTAHIAAAGAESVIAIDPMYQNEEFERRSRCYLSEWMGVDGSIRSFCAQTSARAMVEWGESFTFNGFVIDGDHDHPNPTTDAAMAVCRLKNPGAILFHDARGGPVKSAVKWLLNYFPEFHHQVYPSPHGVVLCWRGELDPPQYVPPPGVPRLEI